MLYDPRIENNTSESIVIDILSKKPRLTTGELYDFYIAKAKKKITIQGFYKLIRQMLERRILVKEGAHLSLDSFWIDNLLKLSETVKRNYLANKIGLANVILEEGESKIFSFENISAMDNFWCHSLNAVINFYNEEEHKDKNGYSRNFYSLFQIARTASENVLANTYQLAGAHWYMASGSNSFLNKLVSKLIEVENYHQFIYDFEEFKKKKIMAEKGADRKKSPQSLSGDCAGTIEEKTAKGLSAEKNYWVTAIGDFIFEAKIPKYIFEIIEKIYDETNSLAEYNATQINNLFFEPGKAELTISRNKKRADAIREEVKNLYKLYEIYCNVKSKEL
ncbi:hypothetical protein A2Y83_05015 [Candidatus Falkowbacteria bacterium RBG_13_39_14]|uniref:Uncharacterized protein n=1 Tax=Candidatus Falkowbacteria bacterium RBG_13_39_14 TaxID=1797985 RepID=A0A1F5S3L5_9BACT|nr:MAG: hypothetical protein A2Y83_05015 [Candidatus Falkowbacteria bacterium RBG_13_39_14]